jgi:hypothetical protein
MIRSFILSIAFLLAFTACSLLPQYRVFQKKVDPSLADKPKAQLEAERRAADFIETRSAASSPDPVKQLQEIHAVAADLSASLGEPQQAPGMADAQKIIRELRAGLLQEQKKADAWKAFAKKYANTPLENTGIDLVGPAGVLGLVGVVAACIACPAFGWVLLRLVPLLWGALKRMTAGIETFAREVPDAAEQLKVDYLARKMDSPDKRLVKRIKAKLKPEALTTDPTPAKS